MQNQYPVARVHNIITQDLKDEILIYNQETNKAYSLNPTSAFVWSMCSGQFSVKEIESAVEKQFGGTVGAEFIWLTLDLLKKNDLLVNAAEIKPNFGGLSRREVIHKAGLASFAALPVVISLTAPKAAAAASGAVGICDGSGAPCPNIGGSCSVPGYCIPAGGGNFFFCSAGGVCVGYGSCFGIGTCINQA